MEDYCIVPSHKDLRCIFIHCSLTVPNIWNIFNDHLDVYREIGVVLIVRGGEVGMGEGKW